MSFCKSDIIIQFAVQIYDCTLYERSLQLTCFHNGFFTGPRYELTNHYITSFILKKSVAGHAPGWSSSLFVFEDFNDDIGKFRQWNREHCKSSEFMLKAKIEIEFLGQNSTPNPIRHQLLAAYLLAR